jgi:hypothetical protein
MEASGIAVRGSDWASILLAIGNRRHLKGGIAIMRHGIGVWVRLPGGDVDFDFSTDETPCRFLINDWHIAEYGMRRAAHYGFTSRDEIRDRYRRARQDGEIA